MIRAEQQSQQQPRQPQPFDGVEVFSATMNRHRERLGEAITEWMRLNEGKVTVVDIIVTQSSDQQFHCLTYTVLYRGRATIPASGVRQRILAESK